MAMSKLQQMVALDALTRFRKDNKSVYNKVMTRFEIDENDDFVPRVPGDRQIKENGYEAAVEKVYQQIVALGKAE